MKIVKEVLATTKVAMVGTQTIEITGTVITDHVEKVDEFSITVPQINDTVARRKKAVRRGEVVKEKLKGDVATVATQLQNEMLDWVETIKKYPPKAEASSTPSDPPPTPGA